MDCRRKYPTDNVGAKNEWRGLIKHQNEINQDLNQIEQEVRGLKSKDLQADYEAKS